MGELSIFDLNPFIEKHKCQNYVETGTGVAVCLQHALKYDFKNYYSVDLDEDLVNSAQSLANDKVTISHDYSTQFLEKLVPTLPVDEPVLFFLDAHFPGADFHKMTYVESITKFREQAFPLVQELDIIIKNRDISKDSFIIDDWKLYDREHSYEFDGWEYKDLQEELGLYTPASEIIDKLVETHDCEVKTRHQGFLFATPKN